MNCKLDVMPSREITPKMFQQDFQHLFERNKNVYIFIMFHVQKKLFSSTANE